MINDFTFLGTDQIYGSNTCKQLGIFSKRGVKAPISDYAILKGGFVSDSNYAYGGNQLADRTGWYWTKTDNGANNARVVDGTGHKD